MRMALFMLVMFLPATPLLVLLYGGDYPSGLIYLLLAITLIIEVIGVVRGKGSGAGGLFSLLSSSFLLVLGLGYVPYYAHFALGSINQYSLPYLGLAMASSCLAYFLGSTLDASQRLLRRIRELGYDDADELELNRMGDAAIIMGVAALFTSFLAYLIMRIARLIILAPLFALMLFSITYLVLTIIARRHRF